MRDRAGLFEGVEDFDVSTFAPKKPAKPQEQPAAEAVRAVSENAQFRSREPQTVPKAPMKTDRRYRTGRNIQLNTKVDLETNELLYRLHDAHKDKENWTLGQIIGLALKSFERELAGKL